MADLDQTALIVVDAQLAFDDAEYWGHRNNAGCEANIAALVAAWRAAGRPLVLVRHDPDLAGWLRDRGLDRIAICGITTNHCCETTARVGGNLGFDVRFVADATYTFDRAGPDGVVIAADDLARATAASLHGEFATVVGTWQLLA
jgi:nicotinamidase-related amidase